MTSRRTFGQVVDEFLASDNVTKFRNEKHRRQWIATLGAPARNCAGVS